MNTAVQPIIEAARRFQERDGGDAAAALTYRAVLSIFPAILMLVAIAGLVADGPGAVQSILDVIAKVGPPGTAGTFRGTVEGVVRGSGSAAALMSVGFAGAIWAATGWVDAFFRVANAIAGVPERRPFLRRKAVQIAFTLAAAVGVAALALILVVSGPIVDEVASWISADGGLRSAWSIARWPLGLVVAVVLVSAVYVVAPAVRRRRRSWVSVGAAAAVGIWIAATALFGVYVGNFGSYNATYGALGAAIVFLIWLWLTNAALIFGFTLDTVLEDRRSTGPGAAPPPGDEAARPPTEVARSGFHHASAGTTTGMDTTETGDARLEADRARHPIDEANLESQSTVELVETLGRRLTALMRAEVALLKTDTIARARGVVGAAAAGAAGALLAACALGVLCAAGLLALAIVLPAWAAALAMAGGLGLLAVICGLVARTLARRAAPPIPRTAIDQLREDVTWLKSPRRSSSGSH